MKRLNHIIILIIISIVGLAVNFGFFFALRDIENEKMLQDFDFSVKKRITSIERSIESQHLAMVALQNHLTSTQDRDAFKSFTTPFLDRVIGIQALEWIPRVLRNERTAYVSDARRDGYLDYEFKVRNNSGDLVVAPNKSEYYPVYYLEPYEGNEAALGFDLSSTEARLNTLNDAMVSGEFRTTRKINLIQGNSTKTGILTFLPVYNRSAANLDELERQEQIKGFALGVFAVSDLIDDSISYLSDDRIDLYVTDITNAASPEILHYHNSTSEDNTYDEAYFTTPPSGLHDISTLSINNRVWQITSVPTPEYLKAFQSSYSYVFLAVGLLATILLVGYLNVTTTRTITVNNLVETRTRELMLSKQEAEKAKEIAEKANKSKTEFISNVSHELRTPLNGILGLSHTILKNQNDNLSDQQLKGLDMIHRSGMRLLDLINDILDLAKIEAGSMSYHKRPVRIKGLVDHVEHLFKGLMENRISKKQEPLDLFIRTEGFTPEFIQTDRRRLEQILINIIGNAVKFTPSGSITLTIKMVESSIWFEILDTGIGIPEDQLNCIFDKFQQVDGSSSRSYEGTGLGLSLSKSLVELLGGEIAVESDLGKGTNMKFGFLLREVDKKLDIAPYEIHVPKEKYYPYGHNGDQSKVHDNIAKLKHSLNSAKKGDEPLENSTFELTGALRKDEYSIIQNKSVLLCSSNDSTRTQIANCMLDYDVKLTERANATTAFEIITDIHPDIIILEPNLPDMDASAFVNMIQSVYTTIGAGFIIVGGNDNKAFATTDSRISIVNMPLDAEVLLDTVSQTLRYRQVDKSDNRKHLLIADDESVGRELLKMMFEKDYNLSFAENGFEAVQLYFENRPDLVLMDIMMPKLDGIGALEKIIEREPEHVPIIALTAKAMKDDERDLLDKGFNGYISKPFNARTMPEIVKGYLMPAERM